MAPNQYTIKYLVGLCALVLDRPRETVKTHAWMDLPDPRIYSTRPATAWWFSYLAEARHVLGE